MYKHVKISEKGIRGGWGKCNSRWFWGERGSCGLIINHNVSYAREAVENQRDQKFIW